MLRMVPHGAMPLIFAVTLVHVFPSLVVTCTCPSLLPVHKTPFVKGDSAMTYNVEPSKVIKLSELIPPEFC